MALNFPASPVDGQTYAAPNGVTYTYHSPPGRWSAAGSGGTVNSVAVALANGFGGNVANPTTDPVITLSTPVNGMLRAEGGALVSADAGVDYEPPIDAGSTSQYWRGDKSWQPMPFPFVSAPPGSSSAAGIAGTVTWDADYLYVCVAADTWKRIALATF